MFGREVAVWCCVFGCAFNPSCGFIVDGDVAAIACSGDTGAERSDCPRGMACNSGICVACASKEICGNGADDDCDGAVDDSCADGETGELEGCFGDGCPPGSECVRLETDSAPECLKPCLCSSTECPEDQFCQRVPFSSKGWCVSPEQAGLGGTELGSLSVGDSCDANSECRSGRCARSGGAVCVDVCCDWEDCPPTMGCFYNTYWSECTLLGPTPNPR